MQSGQNRFVQGAAKSWQKNWSLKSGSHALSRPSISRLIAEVDGKSTPIFRADILFRVGTHRVTFRFAPFSLANLRVALNTTLGWTAIGH